MIIFEVDSMVGKVLLDNQVYGSCVISVHKASPQVGSKPQRCDIVVQIYSKDSARKWMQQIGDREDGMMRAMQCRGNRLMMMTGSTPSHNDANLHSIGVHVLSFWNLTSDLYYDNVLTIRAG